MVDLSALSAKASLLRVKMASGYQDLIRTAFQSKNLPMPRMLNVASEEASNLSRAKWLSRLTMGLSDKPGFHLRDRLLGGLAGAPAGYAIDSQLPGHDDSPADTARRAGASLLGFVAGGKGLNAAKNVGRRYISNTMPLHGYHSARPGFSLAGLWRHGVRDLPSESAKGNELRHELFRRYLGLHSDGPGDYFVRNADRSLSMSPTRFQPGSPDYEKYVRPGLESGHFDVQVNNGAVDQAALQKAPGYSSNEFLNPFRRMFGSHDTRHVPGTATDQGGGKYTTNHTVGDVWNFAIDPHESDEMRTYIKGLMHTPPHRWKQYLGQQASEVWPAAEAGDSVLDRYKLFGMRSGVESSLKQHAPVIRQQMRLHYQLPEGQTNGLLSPSHAELVPSATKGDWVTDSIKQKMRHLIGAGSVAGLGGTMAMGHPAQDGGA